METLCDCGDVYDMPEGFLDGGAMAFFRFHGHTPRWVELRCPCGSRHKFGPGAGPVDIDTLPLAEKIRDAYEAHTKAWEWYATHQPHELGLLLQPHAPPVEDA